MKHDVVFSPEARDDLVDLYVYIAENSGSTRAKSFTDAIVANCLSLDLFPERGIAREEFIGKTVHELYPSTPEVAERLHAANPHLQYGADIVFWLDKLKPDGSAIPFESSSANKRTRPKLGIPPSSSNARMADLPRYWPDNTFDLVTFEAANEHIARHKPRVLYIGLGETDDEIEHGMSPSTSLTSSATRSSCAAAWAATKRRGTR